MNKNLSPRHWKWNIKSISLYNDAAKLTQTWTRHYYTQLHKITRCNISCSQFSCQFVFQTSIHIYHDLRIDPLKTFPQIVSRYEGYICKLMSRPYICKLLRWARQTSLDLCWFGQSWTWYEIKSTFTVYIDIYKVRRSIVVWKRSIKV